MVKFLTERPIAVIMSFIAFVILGVVSFFKLPVSLMPDIDIPEIIVQVSHKNTSVTEMENVIVKPLRTQLMQISNLKDISSETTDGSSTIHLKFEYGTDNTLSFIDANEKIDVAMRNLPKELERPRVVKMSASDIPVFNINISLKEDSTDEEFIELGELCDAVFKRRIEQLPEVALVDVTGFIDSELYIIPDKNIIQSLGISHEEIQSILQNNNITYGSILVNEGEYRYNIRFLTELKTLDHVKDIFIKSGDKILQLKDIAQIGFRAREQKGIYLNNKKRAINLAVVKQNKARLSDLNQKVNVLIERFKSEFPETKLTLSQDQTKLLNYTITNLKQSLVLGSFLAFVLMFFFLKDIKSPFLIGFSIPASLIVSLLFFNVIGLSINIISLSGLILGIGMMIDNSIIVIDNISQYLEEGTPLIDACIKGTNDVAKPLVSSVLTTCAVFLPLLFLSGISGALFYDQAMAVVIGLTVSLIVAITLLPVLFKLFHHNENNGNVKIVSILKRIKVFNLENLYKKGFTLFFTYKKISIAVFLSMMLISFVLFNVVKKEKLPEITQEEIMVHIDWNDNINVDENLIRTRKYLEFINDLVETTNAYVGEQQYLLNKEKKLRYSESRIYIKIKATSNLSVLKEQTEMFFKTFNKTGTYHFNKYKTLFDRLFSDDSPDLVAKVISTTDAKIPKHEVIYNIKDQINDKLGVVSSEVMLQEHIVINLDAEKLVLYDVTQSEVFSVLKSHFNVLNIDMLRASQKYIPIVISDRVTTINETLKNTTIQNRNNVEIRLSALVSLKKEKNYKVLHADEQGQFVPMAFNLDNLPDDADTLISTIHDIINEHQYLDVFFDGNLFSGKKIVKEMGYILCISVLLLYFILAAQFESLTQPLIVLLEIPIDIAGALAMLSIFGASLNLMSMIGIVVMSGIIINDSILKIATINQLRKQGNDTMTAIKKAGVQRLKPILMTSLTTILTLVPFMFYSDLGSELQKPFALAVIGGMILGTFVSLYFIPLSYYYLYFKKTKTNA